MRTELTKRADYAIRAMLSLAGSDEAGPHSVRRIAAEMGIPAHFLPQVMTDLGRAGLVRAEAGRNGGYRLARAAAEIDLLEVIEAVGADGRRRQCVLRGGPCDPAGECAVHDVFVTAERALRETLAAADLATIAAGRRPQVGDRLERTAASATSQPATTVSP